MKRGGPLKRKTPLRAKSPMKRTTMKRSRKRKRASAVGKHWENPKYLEWVKTQPCVLTGQPADEAHHLIGLHGTGAMGMTAPDFMTMPVTRGAHQQIHEKPELQAFQALWVLQPLEKAFREGVLVMAK